MVIPLCVSLIKKYRPTVMFQAHHAVSYARVPERALHRGVRLQAAVPVHALGAFHSFLPGLGARKQHITGESVLE